MKSKAILILTLCILTLWNYAEEVYRISISKGLKKKPLVVYAGVYKKNEKISQKDVSTLNQLIQRDLEISGLITLMGDKKNIQNIQGKEDFKTFNIQNWQSIGPEFIIKVSIEDVLGTYKLSYHIFDFLRQKKTGIQSVTQTRKNLNKGAHILSEKILLSLTGQKGLSQTRIAFVSDHNGKKTIYSCDLSGKGLKQLVTDPTMAISPDWAHDRSFIVFTSYRKINPGIFKKDLSTNRFESLALFPGLNANPRINSLNELVFTASRDGNPEIYYKNLMTGEVKRLTRRYGVDATPTWSSNNQLIAFVSQAKGTPQIYTMNKNGQNIQQITKSGSYNTTPCFSPDNQYITYTTRIMRKMNIALYDLRSRSSEILISHMKDSEGPYFAPDSKHIAFASNRGKKWNIYVQNIETKKIFQITKGFGNCTNPSWR